MLRLILQSLYLFLPAFIANMTPILVKKHFRFLAKPIDFGIKFRGKPLLGKNKTFRGLICAVIVSMIIALIQSILYQYPAFEWLSIVDYSQINYLLLGFLMGAGAMAGDLIKSFFKRQLNIKPGKSWMPFDQIDFLIGGLLFMSIIYMPSWQVIIAILIFGFIFHILFNMAGYLLKIKKTKL